MNEQSKQKLNTLARKLNLTVAKEMKYNVTHVLFDGENTCARTLNYMKGILMGIWIVSLKWLEDSVEKGFLLEENEYEAKGSSKLPFSNGPYKGRMNFSCQVFLFEYIFGQAVL
jgi:BRCA1-associated RING domain protein 1